jgi:peroxiredoxin
MAQTTRLYQDLQRRSADDSGWAQIYDRFVARLTALEAGHSAPCVGTPFPDLKLPDHLGQYQSLAALRADRPMILSFVRGRWCPYCRGELDQWRDQMPALTAAGGRLVVVVGEVAGGADRIHALLGGDAIVLCDIDHGAALDLGLAHHAGADLLQSYRHAGLDLTDVYGTASGILPIPATFLIDSGGQVREAFVEPDFRIRADPKAMVTALTRL